MNLFQRLPQGARFEFQGERYTKVGPLTAIHQASGQQRMIPRSAAIHPLDEGASHLTTVPRVPLEPERIVAALERFEAHWRRAADAGQVAIATLLEAQAVLKRELVGEDEQPKVLPIHK